MVACVRAAALALGALLNAWAELRTDARVGCSDAQREPIALAERLGLSLQREAVTLAPLLREADWVIGHGGGLSSEALSQHGLGTLLNPEQPGVLPCTEACLDPDG